MEIRWNSLLVVVLGVGATCFIFSKCCPPTLIHKPQSNRTFAGLNRRSLPQQTIRWVPDSWTRQEVEKYPLSEITALRFAYGNLSDGGGDPNNQIKEPELIRGFVAALLHAEMVDTGNKTVPLLLNRGDKLQLLLKHQNENKFVPEFPFRAGSSKDGYGPEFDQMLLKLGDYRAEELHRFVRQYRKTIDSVKLVGYDQTLQPANLNRFLAELENAAGKDLFGYTWAHTWAQMTLRLKGGRQRMFHLRVRDYLPNEEGTPKEINPALPQILQEAIREQGEVER